MFLWVVLCDAVGPLHPKRADYESSFQILPIGLPPGIPVHGNVTQVLRRRDKMRCVLRAERVNRVRLPRNSPSAKVFKFDKIGKKIFFVLPPSLQYLAQPGLQHSWWHIDDLAGRRIKQEVQVVVCELAI